MKHLLLTLLHNGRRMRDHHSRVVVQVDCIVGWIVVVALVRRVKMLESLSLKKFQLILWQWMLFKFQFFVRLQLSLRILPWRLVKLSLDYWSKLSCLVYFLIVLENHLNWWRRQIWGLLKIFHWEFWRGSLTLINFSLSHLIIVLWWECMNRRDHCPL